MNIKSAINTTKLSEKIFFTGIFLLASTMSIGIFLIIISSIVSLFNKKENPFKDKWSIFLLVISFSMFASSLYQSFTQANKDLIGWDISLTWIGLLNWIPFFYLFISIKDFVKTNNQRFKVAIFLLSGSIPVLITGFGQYFFNWHGPIKFLNGLIIWYLKPIEPHLGLSGLFSNQNYAGTWMSIIWPLSLGLYFINKDKLNKKFIFLVFLLLLTFAIILTTSRNALIGILVSIPIIMGFKSFFVLFTLTLIIFLIFYFQSSNSFFEIIINFISNIFPTQFFDKFDKANFINIFEYRRINLWKDSINLILTRPLFGLGAASFPILYDLHYKTNSYTEQHTHNLFLEISAGYGFISSSMIFFFIVSIIFYAFRELSLSNLKNQDSLVNKAWVASTIVILLSQMNDITYYDGRISVIFWILLCGSKNIFESGSAEKSSRDQFKN